MRIRHALLPLLLLLALSCTPGRRYDAELSLIDSLQRLDSIAVGDTEMADLVDYYSRHGSANRHAFACYLQGRLYYLQGLYIPALKNFKEVPSLVDTTRSDFDWRLLMKAYACQSDVFDRQRMGMESLESYRQMGHYARLAGDTLSDIRSRYGFAHVYLLLDRRDSAAYYFRRCAEEYREAGDSMLMAASLASLVPIYNSWGRYDESARLISQYDRLPSRLLDDSRVRKGREIHYYNKGMYFLGTHRLDSAEYYFRKEGREGKDYNNQLASFVGLSRLFRDQSRYDSAYKYSVKAHSLENNSYSESLSKNLQELSAAYDYGKYRQQSERLLSSTARSKAGQLTGGLVILFLSGLAAFGGYYAWYRHQSMQKKLQDMLEENRRTERLLQEYNDKRDRLSRMLDDGNPADTPDKSLYELLQMKVRYANERLHLEQIDRSQSEDVLHSSPAYAAVLQKSATGERLDDGDWVEIYKLVDLAFPRFFPTLDGVGKLSSHQLRVSMLLKLKVDKKTVSCLTFRSPQAISSTCSRLYDRYVSGRLPFTSWDDFINSL